MPGIAFFDFDGTITKSDSMFRFILFYHGITKTMIGLFKVFHIIALHKLGFVGAKYAKEKVLSTFFASIPETTFNQAGKKFSHHVIPKLIRKDIEKHFDYHRKNGNRIVVVSASAENWLSTWCHEMNFDLIATQLEITNGCITGKLKGDNCKGREKVRRIRANFDLSQYSPIYAYGNSSGDTKMLKLADYRFYKKFDMHK